MAILGLLLSAPFGTSIIQTWKTLNVPVVFSYEIYLSCSVFSTSSSESPWSISILTLFYYVTFSVNLNLMIFNRLYPFRRGTSKVMGSLHAVNYTSTIAMLVKSAALMPVDTMLHFFIIPFATGNPFANIPLSSGVQAAWGTGTSLISRLVAMVTYMIIFRVALGIAWTSQTIIPSVACLMRSNETGDKNVDIES